MPSIFLSMKEEVLKLDIARDIIPLVRISNNYITNLRYNISFKNRLDKEINIKDINDFFLNINQYSQIEGFCMWNKYTLRPYEKLEGRLSLSYHPDFIFKDFNVGDISALRYLESILKLDLSYEDIVVTANKKSVVVNYKGNKYFPIVDLYSPETLKRDLTKEIKYIKEKGLCSHEIYVYKPKHKRRIFI
jgi:hypothetical protein